MKQPLAYMIKETVNNWSPEALDKLLRIEPIFSTNSNVFGKLVKRLVETRIEEIQRDEPDISERVRSIFGEDSQSIIQNEVSLNDELIFTQIDPTAQQQTSLYFKAYKTITEGATILEAFRLLCPPGLFNSYQVIDEITLAAAYAIVLREAKQPEQKKGEVKKLNSLADILAPGVKVSDIEALLVGVKAVNNAGKLSCKKNFLSGVTKCLLAEDIYFVQKTSHRNAYNFILLHYGIELKSNPPNASGPAYEDGYEAMTNYLL